MSHLLPPAGISSADKYAFRNFQLVPGPGYKEKCSRRRRLYPDNSNNPNKTVYTYSWSCRPRLGPISDTLSQDKKHPKPWARSYVLHPPFLPTDGQDCTPMLQDRGQWRKENKTPAYTYCHAIAAELPRQVTVDSGFTSESQEQVGPCTCDCYHQATTDECYELDLYKIPPRQPCAHLYRPAGKPRPNEDVFRFFQLRPGPFPPPKPPYYCQKHR